MISTLMSGYKRAAGGTKEEGGLRLSDRPFERLRQLGIEAIEDCVGLAYLTVRSSWRCRAPQLNSGVERLSMA
jgi:hypothetical protein